MPITKGGLVAIAAAPILAAGFLAIPEAATVVWRGPWTSPEAGAPAVSGGEPALAVPARGSFDFAGAEARLREAAARAGAGWPIPNPSLHVFKGRRTIELRSGDTLVSAYRVGLGNEPHLDKEREGDHRTPEGEFYVCTRNQNSSFHLFLGISYPASEDAERGLRDGLIGRRQHRAILGAQRRRGCPLWNTKLGGQVGVHGGGSQSDWTWGCIALDNPGIEELWLACPMGTTVVIEK
jgi:hypothetical protein